MFLQDPARMRRNKKRPFGVSMSWQSKENKLNGEEVFSQGVLQIIIILKI
jgi:hypothetical protein